LAFGSSIAKWKKKKRPVTQKEEEVRGYFPGLFFNDRPKGGVVEYGQVLVAFHHIDSGFNKIVTCFLFFF
jgi:hypothetical protein